MDTGAIRTVMPLFYLYLWSIKTQPSGAFSLLKLLIRSVALVCSLLLCSSNALAAQVVFAWNDPNNNPAEGGGSTLSYWQTDWDTPAKVNIGQQTIYTLTIWKPG